jgi:hypothetical protein
MAAGDPVSDEADAYPADLTRLLREDSGAFWTRLRECLQERDVDPGQAILAESFMDDSQFEFGILVLPGERVIQFGFRYPAGQEGEGTLVEWMTLTHRWRISPYRNQVEAALPLLSN